MQLYIDCDGVLANFEALADHVLEMNSREYEKLHGSDKFWAQLGAVEDFFYNLEPMHDAQELYDAVKHLNPIVLTGSPSQLGEQAYDQKRRWIAKIFGPDQKVIVCQSKNKYQFCEPGDAIIDDWPKHQKKWEDAGGIWVAHTSTVDTIAKLKELGIL